MNLSSRNKSHLDNALQSNGLRSTRQREVVYGVILGERDHPTADEIYSRAKQAMPSISLATVYNCLETLVECGLVRQVNFERESTRFCPNLSEHAHFYCRETGRVYDIPLSHATVKELSHALPNEFEMETFELTFRGHGPEDAAEVDRETAGS